ncbi:MAG: hypothetical protein ACR2RV_12300 [Verrucomicrobiales bacterium]
MPLVDRLERNYGWIAIPGIVKILVGFQALSYLLIELVNREIAGQLMLDPQKVLSGEVWRLVSWAILPPSMNPLILLIVLFFTMFLGNMLESMWGSFRLTLYVFGGIIGFVAGAFLAYATLGYGGFAAFYVRAGTSGYLWVTVILFAVAVLNPGLQISLYGVIPVKIVWVAVFRGGLLVIEFIQLVGIRPVLGVSLLLAISNFLIVFGPRAIRQMRQSREVAARRRKFESAKLPEDEALHRCEVCGKTEHSDPDIEFRVAADGEEYCADHLPGRSTD